jgi:hypothetical protein
VGAAREQPPRMSGDAARALISAHGAKHRARSAGRTTGVRDRIVVVARHRPVDRVRADVKLVVVRVVAERAPPKIEFRMMPDQMPA